MGTESEYHPSNNRFDDRRIKKSTRRKATTISKSRNYYYSSDSSINYNDDISNIINDTNTKIKNMDKYKSLCQQTVLKNPSNTSHNNARHIHFKFDLSSIINLFYKQKNNKRQCLNYFRRIPNIYKGNTENRNTLGILKQVVNPDTIRHTDLAEFISKNVDEEVKVVIKQPIKPEHPNVYYVLQRENNIPEGIQSRNDSIPTDVINKEQEMEIKSSENEELSTDDARVLVKELNQLPTDELFKLEQDKDPIVSILKNYTRNPHLYSIYYRQIPLYIRNYYEKYENEIVNDIYYIKRRLYVPSSLRGHVLYYMHVNWHHLGKDVLTKIISTYFYWPGLYRDVLHYVENCGICFRCKRKGISVKKGPMKLFPATRPGEIVQIDLVGPLSTTKEGYTYFVTVIDRFSRYMELLPIRDMEALTVALAFHNKWFCKFGAPSVILSDRGSQFTSKIWKSLLKIIGTKRKLTTAYYPQCNGLAERYNRFVKERLNMIGVQYELDFVSKRDCDSWANYLDSIAFRHNLTPIRSTRIPPIQHILGYLPNVLGSLENDKNYKMEKRTPKQWIAWTNKMRKIYKGLAIEQQSKYDKKRKLSYDKLRHKDTPLQVGDRVCVDRSQELVTKKLKAHLGGPVLTVPGIITKINTGNRSIKIKWPDGKEDTYSRSRVVLFLPKWLVHTNPISVKELSKKHQPPLLTIPDDVDIQSKPTIPPLESIAQEGQQVLNLPNLGTETQKDFSYDTKECKCFCGTILTKTLCNKYYTQAKCDKCNRIIRGNNEMYHCNNNTHPIAIDFCLKCMEINKKGKTKRNVSANVSTNISHISIKQSHTRQSQEEEKESTISSKSKRNVSHKIKKPMRLKCWCGKKFSYGKASEFYTEEAICDGCDQEIELKDNLFHCEGTIHEVKDTTNETVQHGRDLCKVCVSKQ